MNFFRTLFVFMLSLSLYATQESPCPRTLRFQTEKAEDDRWYGVITLSSRFNLRGVTLQIYFDKSVIQLGNFLGQVKSNSDNTVFIIKNDKKEIRANTPLRVRIYVVFDPYYDNPPPQIKKIVFNGKEICPKYEEQDFNPIESNIPSISVNINVPQCGTTIVITGALITKGQVTSPGQYPWHAALYLTQAGSKKKNYICGGNLISDKYILTAAHCTTEYGTTTPRNPNTLTVILGKYGMFVIGKNEQTRKASNIIVHPEFNRTSFFNDISIIEMSSKIQLSDYVRPICLWSEETKLDHIFNRIGIAVGWGMDEEGNQVTDLLMQAEMPVLNTLNCLFTNRDFYSKLINDKNFCAGYGNGTSVCNGDSGGGLIFPKTGTSGVNTVWQLRGLVSNSIPKAGQVCDPQYSVIFTDVAQYLDWIEKSITKD